MARKVHPKRYFEIYKDGKLDTVTYDTSGRDQWQLIESMNPGTVNSPFITVKEVSIITYNKFHEK